MFLIFFAITNKEAMTVVLVIYCLTHYPKTRCHKTIINIYYCSRFLLVSKLGAALLGGFGLSVFYKVAVKLLAGL